MSKVKSLSRAGWVIVGLTLALLLLPTMAVAATLTYNGIEGTNGKTTTLNKVQVTSAGQLLTNEAEPSKYVDTLLQGDTCNAGGSYTVPSGDALIITGVDFYMTSTGSPGEEETDLWDGPSSTPCTHLLGAGITDATAQPNIAEYQAFQPGIAVPAGDSVAFVTHDSGGAVQMYGYLVPSAADVPAVAGEGSTWIPADRSPTLAK